MADLTTSLIPNLISGVSQQADAQRSPQQAETQINAVSSLAEGLRKREGSRLLAQLGTAPIANTLLHVISRDQSERYLALIGPGSLKVFDFKGQPETVDTSAGTAYLAAITDPHRQVNLTTLADYTFFSNTEVKPAMKPAKAPVPARPKPHEALIWVRAANYGQDYRVDVNGQTVTVSAPVNPVTIGTGGATTENRISTEAIAAAIKQGLESKTPGVTWTQNGAVLWLQSDTTIAVGATASLGQRDILVITNQMRSFTDLPRVAPVGYQVYLEGDPTNPLDDYYVEFKLKPGQTGFGEGYWAETVAPGVEYELDPLTMPHVLIRLPSGSFWFGPADGQALAGVTVPSWGKRTAGDLTTSPNPTFIGKSIRDIFVWRNRLGFLADEAVILSRTGEFFEFFPETVTTTLATDPVDLLASGDQVSVLRYAVVFQDELVIFSDQQQFRFSAQGGPLSAETATFSVLTRYEIDVDCRPIQVGPNVVFCQANGEWSRFREYRMRSDGTNVLADADDLTEAVPNYVPSQTFRLTAEQTSNSWYALSRSPGYENRLWVNKYLYRNSGEGVSRQQNAWSEWRLDVDRIVDMAAYDETLFLVTEYAGKVWLESMPITDASPIARTLPLGLLLDSWLLCPFAPKPGDPPGPVLPQVQVPPGVYDHAADTTTWTLPFAVTSKWEAWSSLYTPLGSHWLGTIEAGASFSTQGDWSGQTVVFGKPFEFVYRMTRFKSYQTLGAGQVARNAYRTQVRKACLRFHDSEYFEAHVFAEGRPPAVYKFGPTPFNRNNRVGQEPWDYDRYQATKLEREGVFSIPIMSRGDVVQVELRSSAPRPCKFLTVEWIGLLTGKARR